MDTKKAFGGKQDGAGRPELSEEEKKPRVVVFPSPENYGRLVESVGKGRGAMSREIDRILDLYFSETRIV